MAQARLLIYSSGPSTRPAPGQAVREMELSGGASIGRARDNSIQLDGSEVSLYHAIIEERADGFWLSDLGSAHGTEVNQQRIAGTRKLADGDVISIGNAGTIEFRNQNGNVNFAAFTPARKISQPSPSLRTGGASKRVLPKWWLGVGGGLLVVILAILLALFTASPGKVRLLGIDENALVQQTTEVSLLIERPGRVGRVTFELDGIPVAKSQRRPFTFTFDPAQVQSEGGGAPQAHELTARIKPRFGWAARTVSVKFRIGCLPPENSKIAELMNRLLETLQAPRRFDFDSALVTAVGAGLCKYKQLVKENETFPESRSACVAFGDNGLGGKLGLILALSEKVEPLPAAGNERIGLWQLPKADLLASGLIGTDVSEEQLHVPEQAAKIAAGYAKEIQKRLANPIFLAACFGSPQSEVLEASRRLEPRSEEELKDLWALRGELPPLATKRLIRFFAVGIIALDPATRGAGSQPLLTLCGS